MLASKVMFRKSCLQGSSARGEEAFLGCFVESCLAWVQRGVPRLGVGRL